MKESVLTITIIIMLVLISVAMIFLVKAGDAVTPVQPVETVENSVEKVECEHDWVLTSEYDWFRASFRNVSKCSRCGKVVK